MKQTTSQPINTMITEEHIKTEIGKLRIELATLQGQHEQMVRNFQQTQADFNQRAVANQNRFQQISGAIANLTALLNPEEPSDNGQPPAPRSRKQRPPQTIALPRQT